MIDMKVIVNNRFNYGASVEEVLGTIDFSEWNFAIETEVRQAVSEAFRNTLDQEPPKVEFETDGVSVILSLQCGSSWNDGVIYFSASIPDMIANFIANTEPAVMYGGVEARTALAKCLHDCASKLGAA